MHKQGSIKTRLILIITVCITGMSILAANQIYNTHQLMRLNNHSQLLLELNNSLLQQRRHEKDFLLRADNQYLDKFNRGAELFKQNMNHLEGLFKQASNTSKEFIELKSSVATYCRLFNELSSLMADIGLDENSGYRGQLRQAAHQLEAQFEADNQTYLHLLLLQLRRNEKDFLLRHNMLYVDQEIRTYQTLRKALVNLTAPQSDAQLTLLDKYQHKFLQLVKNQNTIGLDHNSGLQGEFRRQAHAVEAELSVLNTEIKHLIIAEENKIERFSFLIMISTLGVLIFLLIKSFITLQKAFATFVMFFYRCKREYQHIDERKQGFAEFKYLAMIANEMIDARRAMELELKQAQQEISRLSSHPETTNLDQ
ncbi:hypothetical protein L0668_10675 [Paraglaciecola aquimarina]|uniref:HBM domain-containing protein n=1 Tax=Paraglaciecola algarum TaxID=3050085 RepID=A0ABS9D862_9ALTE|nr:hypothetical protein [Paraglaciecola sp. G1-23]MCF2948572.1 hypothetical protein [Paraglaciecola sp. G1-23]